MPEQKAQLIAKLTGVYTAKRTYYAELKEKIAEITKRNLQLEMLNELALQISINTPLGQIVHNVSESLKQILPFDHVSLYTYRDGMLYLNCFHPCFQYERTEIPQDEGKALWHVIRNPQQMFWQQSGEIKDLHLSRLGMEVAVISPLLAQNKVLGLFVIDSTQKNSYDTADLAFLQQLANQLAIYIHDRELFAEVTRAKIDWELTFKTVQDLIIVVDQEKRILRVNQATVQFCGIPEKNILGKKCCEVICGSPGACSDCAVAKALQTKETAVSQQMIGEDRVMEFYAYPSFHAEGEPGAVIYARDITERLKMEAQLLQTARLAALGEMAAGVAHELNTPLTVILGNVQLLMRDFLNEEQKKKLLQDIKSCGLRCRQIVQGLLTFSRQEQYVFRSLSVNDVVTEALKLVSYQIETNNIQINLHLDQDVPLVEGNTYQLEQVVVNLLLNAKQSFEECEKEKPRMIGVETGYDSERNQVFIKVSDTGSGIPQQNLTRIFDPFFTSKGVGKGTGLGLSVSLGIVQSHGGTIGVESEQGKGSTFTIYLPPTETCEKNVPEDRSETPDFLIDIHEATERRQQNSAS